MKNLSVNLPTSKTKTEKRFMGGDTLYVYPKEMDREQALVEFYKGKFMMKMQDGTFYGGYFNLDENELEVIGNIYENPELLATD